ncbi:crossover junction endodeoxyribonuclease RuvC [Bacteroidaceae bacterium]|nr:crossover junction endodeoxyribonuclease RuvC [Bacteroidaceae bacterium]
MFSFKIIDVISSISIKNNAPLEKIILGIDPGTNIMGYGVIKVTGRKVTMESMGVIDLHRCKDVYLKLGRIYERVIGIIDAFHPDELAIEAPFFGKNVQSMLKLGRAQGVAIAAAISRDIPIHEYAPLKIKMAITGNGQASKEQVAGILKRILNIQETSTVPYLDATDALAAAYCHVLQDMKPFHSSGKPTSSHSWSDFVRQNTNRVSGMPSPKTYTSCKKLLK